MAWAAKLLPRMKNEGAGAVQIGKVEGNVSTNHFTITVIAPKPEPGPEAPAAPLSLTSPEQREVLRLIRQLQDNKGVFLFMERTFGTRMVIDLEPAQLLRVRRYVETIHRRTKGREKA
ncbi:hypothetical protein [Acidovorax sp. NCPPB 3576]|uniref:hypothetical protein n=1 Tax=Acidovorax sp. NCPPB 3576 TaxID=2940488 RepID=UPI00234ABEB8|nr:hypothetical protein [Acidovorax sp. NCPPB 3576]WCM88549.1 hypothetical protein M5C98_00335 [Acidovorax sp. NCPPB 3576]